MTMDSSWRPTASWDALKSRAQQLQYVRGFFAQRGVLEVETPVLGRHGVTDVNLDGVAAQPGLGEVPQGWLQTSPEYHMKRLLAAGSGSIFQVSRVFRSGERGRRHNPEFSMLEWYREGFDDSELMAEVAELVCGWLDCDWPEVVTYREAVRRSAGFDPMTISDRDLQRYCEQWLEPEQLAGLGRDGCLDLVMSFQVEPTLGQGRPAFITHYPASQAALARISTEDGYPVAHRFELYCQGLELCNGYWELTDAREQRQRFMADNEQRKRAGKPEMALDEAFLAAVGAGLPECSGVALGLDRLLMLKLGTSDISDVLAFPIERA
ncbi:EF-P lysine aminoacylase EpmA [Marinobacter persicus]|uniref:Lysyl-tRNA synthetase class 2 n=1 Tax=Marinobacter persicus TaxID=930118 RepID=A0A2S6G9K1_9GAMM|nr:EF-P lysine aminoacylase EpmA [Marinobacter persicus]PPK53034.1 lysyl-tRNA synthetase class 2 [Marinobacter persicus]PPK55911.1 lysyl-tRNA synthetase class 2 [Marinobacter persicus]PPK59506.1 lysyl-tRNA synthetase class 2 [Marinobacter persicus]